MFFNLFVNGQPSANSTTRLIREGMLSVKGQNHVLRHMLTLWRFRTLKNCAYGENPKEVLN